MRTTALGGLRPLILPGLGALAVAYATHLIGSGVALAGLGALALLGYLSDRAGRPGLLAPAGMILGLGAGLTLSDFAQGAPAAWAGAAGLFGLGLLGVYRLESRHAWALICGGPLTLASLAVAGMLLIPLPILGGLLLTALVVGVGLALWRRRPAIAADLPIVKAASRQ
jgi:hypothetical protein